MKPRWKDIGLTEEGAAKAELVYEDLRRAFAVVGADAIVPVAQAIAFEYGELPKRSMEFQRKYWKENS